VKKNETTLSASFTRNNNIHFAESNPKWNAKHNGGDPSEKNRFVAGFLLDCQGCVRVRMGSPNNMMLFRKCMQDVESEPLRVDGLVS